VDEYENDRLWQHYMRLARNASLQKRHLQGYNRALKRMDELYQRRDDPGLTPFTCLVFNAAGRTNDRVLHNLGKLFLNDYLLSKEPLSNPQDRQALCWFIDRRIRRGGRHPGRTRGPAQDAEFEIACKVDRFKKEYRTKHGKRDVPDKIVTKEIERLRTDAAKKFGVAEDKIAIGNVKRWIRVGRLPSSD